MPENILLDLRRAATMLDVHQRTIKRWWRLGKISLVELPGGHYRVSQREIDRLLGNMEDPTSATPASD